MIDVLQALESSLSRKEEHQCSLRNHSIDQEASNSEIFMNPKQNSLKGMITAVQLASGLKQASEHRSR
jgi:hypothetical protein